MPGIACIALPAFFIYPINNNSSYQIYCPLDKNYCHFDNGSKYYAAEVTTLLGSCNIVIWP